MDNANQVNYDQLSFNYIGSLQELCAKLKMTTPEINGIYSDLGSTMCVNSRNLHKMEARVRYAGVEFLGCGESFKKKDAKGFSAKFCLIKFIAYLRAHDYPQLRPEDYGLTDADLAPSADPKMYMANNLADNGLNSSLSSSSSECSSNEKRMPDQSIDRSPTSNSATDLSNSLKDIQEYVNSRVTYRKALNPFIPRSASSPATSDQAAEQQSGLYAKTSNSVPTSTTNSNNGEPLHSTFGRSMNLNGEQDGARILQLNDFRTKNHTRRSDQSIQSDQSEVDEQRSIMQSADDELDGRKYIVRNYSTIQKLFNDYDPANDCGYAAQLYKMIQRLGELQIDFRQKASNESGVIAYQKLCFGQSKCSLVTVYSEKVSVSESAEECAKKIFDRLLLDFKLS